MCLQDDSESAITSDAVTSVFYASLVVSLLLCCYILCIKVPVIGAKEEVKETLAFDIEQGVAQPQSEWIAPEDREHVVAFDDIARSPAASRKLFGVFKLSANRTALVDSESRLDYNALYGESSVEKDTANLLVDRNKKRGILQALLSVVAPATGEPNDNLTENPLRKCGSDPTSTDKKQKTKKQKTKKRKSTKKSVLSIFSRNDSGLGSSLLSGIDSSTGQPADKKRLRTINIFRALRRTNYRKSITDTFVYDANQEPIQFTSNPVMKMLQQRKAAVSEECELEEKKSEEAEPTAGSALVGGGASTEKNATEKVAVESIVRSEEVQSDELDKYVQPSASVRVDELCFDEDF